MQNAADLGVFYQCGDAHVCFTKCEILVRNTCRIGTNFFTCCEELIPIFQSVLFMNCDFHMNYILVQADKAANNVIVVLTIVLY